MDNNKLRIVADEPLDRIRDLAWELSSTQYMVKNESINSDDLRFFRVKKVRNSEDASFAEMMENVISSLRDPGFNYVYVLTGTPSGVTIDFGIGKNDCGVSGKFSNAWNYADILANSFLGNIPGSQLSEIDSSELKNNMGDYSRFAMVTGVPAIPERKDNEIRQAGLDRFINSCQDIKWRLVVTARPVDTKELLAAYEALCSLYKEYDYRSKNSVQISEAIQESEGTTGGTSTSDAHTEGHSGGEGESETLDAKSDHTHSKSGHKDWNKSDTHTEQQSNSTTHNNAHTDSRSVTYEYIHKMRMEIMEYMDNVLFKRIRSGISRGMFRTDIFLMSDNTSDLERVQSLFCAVFGGSSDEFHPLHRVDISSVPEDIQKKIAASFLEDRIMMRSKDPGQLLFGHLQTQTQCGTSTLLTAGELSMIAGLPEKEVIGLPVQPDACFGLNADSSDDDICLGSIISNGNILHGRKVCLPKKSLTRHILVAGVTGSGKTTTCQKLLVEAGIPFLVIEPAKTEYRSLIKTAFGAELEIYTLGNEQNSPFRLNPFELLPGENFTSHVDMLAACFTSAFPMEAALPQILETSIYRCYQKYGWSVYSGTNKYTDDPYTADGRYFPVLEDMKQAIHEVVDEMHFGPTMKYDYIGSLNGRICNLIDGSKGCMLNCRKSVDFQALLDKKVIFELEELRSGNDKSFVMGLILARLSECLKLRHHKQSGFRHITLVEEAHRLLSRIENNESMAKRAAVDSFTDLLAEVRKYGESLVIADQIPNKLAPDVLKNTNTKLIHKLFAADDKDAVGNAMMMDEKQRAYLSSLKPGEIVMFSENVNKPVNLMVESCTDTSAEVPDSALASLFKQMRKENDSLIADHCCFNKISGEQRYSLDMFADEMLGSIKALLKTAPNQDPPQDDEKKKPLINSIGEVMRCLHAAAERAALEESSAWKEYSWRYMIKEGVMMKDFGGMERCYNNMVSLYHDLLTGYPSGKFKYPSELIKELKVYC